MKIRPWLGRMALLGALAGVVMAGARQAPARENGGTGDGGQQQPKNERIFHGKVTAVNAENATITFTNKNGEAGTFTIPAGTRIEVNGKAGTLADVHVEMYGGVKLRDDVPIMLKAWQPGQESGGGHKGNK